MAVAVVREAGVVYQRSMRLQSDYTTRAKRLFRETSMFWRRKEKELIEVKKKKERLEAEIKKKDDEEKEKVLQSKRLEFLMKQSELYAHFMAKKLGTDVGETMKEEGKN